MQKFRFGDLVRVDKDLGRPMRHFTCDCEAIIMYADSENSRQNEASYGIHIKGGGQHAWYHESQLTLIAEKQEHLLEEWPKSLPQVIGYDLIHTVKGKFEMERDKMFLDSFRKSWAKFRDGGLNEENN
jgi:hypothetical protein